MTQEVINVGVNADDGTGDSLYEAGNKINSNFTELFAKASVKSDIKFFDNSITSRLSNADIDVHPSGTGTVLFPSIRFNDNNIEVLHTNDDIKIRANGSGRVTIAGLGFSGTTISAPDSSSVNINENLIVDGDYTTADGFAFSGAQTFATGMLFGNLTLANGSITDSSGAISFGTENLTTTGTITAETDSALGNLTFADGSITDSSGAISFGNENLSTTGTITAATSSTFGNLTLANGSITDSSGAISFGNENLTTTGTSIEVNSTLTVANGSITDSSGAISFGNENVTTTGTIARATGSTIGNLTLANGSITDSSGAISFGNENLTTTATSMAIGGTLTAGSGSITDSTGAISFGNENLTTTGTLTVDGLSTFGSMSVSGATSFADSITVDNLTFNDNIISTSSNADLRLSPGGTGVVNVGNLTIDSSMNFKDNVLKVTTSNADLDLAGSGTGAVQINGIDLNSGTIDNVIVGANEPAAGAFDPLNFTTLVIPNKITFSGNTMSTNRSNDNLEFAANGSGKVIINDFLLPNSDGDTGAFLQTNASKSLAFFVNSISFSESTIVDNQQTIGFSAKTLIDANTAIGTHEQLQAEPIVIDEFAQTKYDSAWYLVLSRNKADGSSIEFQVQKHILAQGTEDGSTFDSFSGSSQIVRSSTSDAAPELASDVRSAVSNVRLTARAGLLADSSVSTDNAVSFFRIGLGDNDSSGTQAGSGLAQTKLVADLDSAAATLDSWAIADKRAAKYFISINNTTTNEVSSTEVLLVHDGTNAFITEFNTIISNGESTPLATFTADISGGNARLRGQNGTAGTCRVTMYRILIADDDSAADGTYVDVLGAKTVTNTAQTTIDTNTFRGTASPDVTSQKTISSFANTFDSVWYHVIHKDITNSEFSMHKYSINQGISSDGSSVVAGFTDSSILNTGAMNDINTAAVAINGSNVDLAMTGLNDGSTAVKNASTYFALGLGDNTADATSGRITTEAGIIVAGNTETKIDHVAASGNTQGILAATRTAAEFTAGEFDGAMYHVVTRDITHGSLETQKISILHNLSDAFITSSAVVSTDESDTHPTFDADIVTADDSSAKIRLRVTDGDGSSVTPSNTMAYYRIGLGDSDSTGYIGELGLVHDIMHVSIIDSTVVNLDTFTKAPHAAAKYFITVNNQSTGETSNIEALVTHDNTNAFITSYNEHFSGNNSLITLTADISGNSVRLRGSATAGGSTKVIVNRVVAFADTESDEANSDSTRKVIGNVTASSSATTFDTFQSSDTDAVNYVICGQNGSDEKFICEASVVTDGTGVFVSQGPNVSTKGTDMLAITATISSGTVSVKASSTSGASTSVSAYAVRLKAPTVITQTIDSFAKASFRGAKYYISATTTEDNSVMTAEAMVCHDGTTAFIKVFNEHNSNARLATFTADMVGTNVVVTGTPLVANTTIKFYKIMLSDSESDATGTDFNTVGAVTVSSTATAIDTFDDTSHTGAHYIIVGHNSGEASGSIMEATVLSNGAEAFVHGGPFVSSKGTSQLSLSASHNGSTTVTLSASSTSGSSTTVNAFRIHMLRGDADSFTELDSFAHTDQQAANYLIAMKDENNSVQFSEVMLVSDGTDAYHSELDINSESTDAPIVSITSAVVGGNVKLRAESTVEQSNTITNVFKIPLTRATGNPTSVATLDTFDKTTHRSASYFITISDSNSGALGNYEVLEARVTHDGTTPYVSVFGRTNSASGDLVTFTSDISGNDVRLRGTISSTNAHKVTVVRRLINL